MGIMETRITNIVLEWTHFMVFATILGNEETMWFDENATADNIRQWVLDRKTYYQDLIRKEEELKEDLLNIEL